MELYKYCCTQGKITLTVDARPFELGFQFQILTGKREEVVLNLMKKMKNIRRVPADQMEVAEYLKTHALPGTTLNKFSDDEIKAEFFRRFPKIKNQIEGIGSVTAEPISPAVGNGSFAAADTFFGESFHEVIGDPKVANAEVVSNPVEQNTRIENTAIEPDSADGKDSAEESTGEGKIEAVMQPEVPVIESVPVIPEEKAVPTTSSKQKKQHKTTL